MQGTTMKKAVDNNMGSVEATCEVGSWMDIN
jgi:hypothetical protein